MSIESKIREMEFEINKLKNQKTENVSKKVYYAVPVEGTSYNGRKTITNILYTTDKFEPGETMYRIYSPEGMSKLVTLAEYAKQKDDKLWFDSPCVAKESIVEKKPKISKKEIEGMLKGKENLNSELVVA